MDSQPTQGVSNLLRMQGMQNETFVSFNIDFNVNRVENDNNFGQHNYFINEWGGDLKDQHVDLDSNIIIDGAPSSFENGLNYKMGDPSVILGLHAENLINEAQFDFHMGSNSNNSKKMENHAAILGSNSHTPTRRSPRLSNKKM